MANVATISSSEVALTVRDHYFILSHDGRRRPPMFWGSPGTAKSEGVREGARVIAEEIDDPDFWLLDYRMVMSDPVDVKGVPYIRALDGQSFTAFAPPFEILRQGNGIIFWDELPQALQSVINSASQPILDYRIGDHVISPGVLHVAAGNRLTDRAGSSRMPTNMANRFFHYSVEPSLQGFIDHATDNNWDPMVVAYLRFKSDDMYKFDPNSDDPAWASLRTWEMLSDMLKSKFGQRLVHTKIVACIGEGIGASFCGFLKVWQDMPDLDRVITDPDSVEIPENNPAACYAICGGLSVRCTQDTFENILRYVSRLEPEFTAAFVLDVTRRDQSLSEISAFAAWAIKNHSMMQGFSASE